MLFQEKLQRTIEGSYTKYNIRYYDDKIAENISDTILGAGKQQEVYLNIYVQLLGRIKQAFGKEDKAKDIEKDEDVKGGLIVSRLMPDNKNYMRVYYKIYTEGKFIKRHRNKIYFFNISP